MEKRLEALGWGLFFIWVGTAWLSGASSGVALLGVGVITLGVQGLRKQSGLRIEGFWVVVGSLFLLGGLWSVFDIRFELVPLLLIAGGILLLLAAIRGQS